MRGLSLLLSTCGLIAAYLLWNGIAGSIAPVADGASAAGRLSLALLWLLPTAGLLWVMLLTQMAIRFAVMAFDPLARPQRRLLAVNQRVISNTVEHGLVFALALLALAGTASSRMMPQVLALAVVFAAARVVFWAGYLIAPMGRAPGMAATAAATAGALGGAIWLWLTD